MTRKEKLAILNGILKGFRPVNDVFADWETIYYYVNRDTDPPTLEDNDGNTVTINAVYQQLRTYPKVKFEPVDQSPKDIVNLVKDLFKIRETAEDYDEENDNQDFYEGEPDTKPVIDDALMDEWPLKPCQIPGETNHEYIPLSIPSEPVIPPPPKPSPPLKPEPPPKMYHIL
jgi:hypothetical protein